MRRTSQDWPKVVFIIFLMFSGKLSNLPNIGLELVSNRFFFFFLFLP